MKIVENTNLNCNLEVTDSIGNVKSVVSINTYMPETGKDFNFNFNIMDKELVDTNTQIVQEQLDSFMTTLRAKMLELGYKITI